MPRDLGVEAREEHLRRVRRICLAMQGATERLSHAEPTFFARKRVFAMFAGNHHHDGHMALWLPAESGIQPALVKSAPNVYFRPPYVGVAGWIGIELSEIGDDDLAGHITDAWQLIVSKDKKKSTRGRPNARR